MFDFDLAIIGSGPAGHSAAFLAAKNKLKTIIFEKSEEKLGGVCLNEGCIPLKGFLFYSKYIKNYSEIKNLVFEKVKILKNGLKSKLVNCGVDLVFSEAKLKSKNEIFANQKIFTAKNILIATGSKQKRLFNLPNVFDYKKIYDLDKLPEKVLIIGAGAIGLELASFFNNLNVKVTIVEILPFLLPNYDREIINFFQKDFYKRQIKILLNTEIKNINNAGEVVLLKENEKIVEKYDLILETTGRESNFDGLNLQEIKIELNENGFIKTDDSFKTSVDNIYAAGDCIAKSMLAYTAAKEGENVVNDILKIKNRKIDYSNIPKIIFSNPQIGTIGKVIENENIKIYKYFFKANGKYFIEGKEKGFLKLFVDKEKDIIIGCSIVGEDICELLNEINIFIENKINIEQIKNTIHIHPSYNEIIVDALNYG